MKRLTAAAAAFAVLAIGACARGVEPAPLDPANTQCEYCRMTASDVHVAAQIAAPGAEPVFFDDIGCLVNYLASKGVQVPKGGVAFVADHRTGAWVRAAEAVFTRAPGIHTPMGGGIVAHANDASRDLDTAAAGGTPAGRETIFGVAGPPNGGGR